jgi:2-keto-3-deoxy-L-rhamnonate aldolase RhmA
MEKRFKNRLKEKLKTGEQAVGIWSNLGSPTVTEIMANVGLDFILFDMEHSPLTVETLAENLRALNGTDCVPLVRVPSNDPVFIKRVLDIGAMGILVPDIRNKEDALKAIQACKYPKEGIRGFASTRASVYGLNLHYPTEANREIIVILHIESLEGVRNIENILSVEGIDAVNLGPGDLSFDMFGAEGREKDNSEKYQKAVDETLKKVVEAAGRRGIPVIGHGSTKVVGNDAWLVMTSLRDRIERVKSGKPLDPPPTWILH